MSRPFVIALLGAESTGKTTLAGEVVAAMTARGRRVARVDEALREFCIEHARTPRADEQAGIAAEQTHRIDAASVAADVVVADTTALMIAVYSDFIFADRGLYASAEAAQRRIDLTLLTALDLPWRADGLQRDGEHVREPIDTLVRAALGRAGVAFTMVSGRGFLRLASALRAIDGALAAER
ncbi:MAG: ATP-binding protein [Pseudomonadota bacterium]|nr:ATP-binding protein [Pseudomonadota bacterium]